MARVALDHQLVVGERKGADAARQVVHDVCELAGGFDGGLFGWALREVVMCDGGVVGGVKIEVGGRVRVEAEVETEMGVGIEVRVEVGAGVKGEGAGAAC